VGQFDREVEIAKRGIMLVDDARSGRDAAAKKKLARAKARTPDDPGITAQEAVLAAKEAAFQLEVGPDGREHPTMGMVDSPKYTVAKKRARAAIDAALQVTATAKELDRRMDARR
jgi:hypothetical protein